MSRQLSPIAVREVEVGGRSMVGHIFKKPSQSRPTEQRQILSIWQIPPLRPDAASFYDQAKPLSPRGGYTLVSYAPAARAFLLLLRPFEDQAEVIRRHLDAFHHDQPLPGRLHFDVLHVAVAPLGVSLPQ